MPDDHDNDLMLRHLVESPASLMELARRHGLTLRDLAGRITDRDLCAMLANLIRLGDVQGQMMISQYRYLAASRLVGMAGNPDSPSRDTHRACVDLIRFDISGAAFDDEPLADDECLDYYRRVDAGARP